MTYCLKRMKVDIASYLANIFVFLYQPHRNVGFEPLQLMSGQMLQYTHSDAITQHVGSRPQIIFVDKQIGNSEVRNL